MLTFDDIRGVGVSRMMMSAIFFQNLGRKQNWRTGFDSVWGYLLFALSKELQIRNKQGWMCQLPFFTKKNQQKGGVYCLDSNFYWFLELKTLHPSLLLSIRIYGYLCFSQASSQFLLSQKCSSRKYFNIFVIAVLFVKHCCLSINFIAGRKINRFQKSQHRACFPGRHNVLNKP